MSIEKVEQVNDTHDKCPACGAPRYNDPLDSLFVPAYPVTVYECGARLIFHDISPVQMEVKKMCAGTRPFYAAVALRELENSTQASHSRYLAERVAELELEAATLRTRLERVTGAGQRVINTARPEPDLPEWEDEFYVPAKSIRALVDALHAEYEILVNCVCGHTSMAHDEQGWCYHQAEGCKCKQFQRAALTGSESGDAK